MTLRYVGMDSAHALRHQFGVSSIPNFGRGPLPVDSTNFDDKTENDVTGAHPVRRLESPRATVV
jgi:hypothetical protein